jgi:AraC-like DNA-binding protein
MVGEMLAAGPYLAADLGLACLQENVRQFARGAGGNLRLRAGIQQRHIRGWATGTNAPRMDSLVALSCSQQVSIVRLLTETINAAPATGPQRSPYSHYRVSDNIAEDALRAAFLAAVPPSLIEIATHLGYRTVASLQSRYPALCAEISRKRCAGLKPSLFRPVVPVPRDRVEEALTEALKKEDLTPLLAVAASVGLRNKRRLYKGFNDLRRAIVAKNKRIKKQRLAAIETAVRAALGARPIPSVTEVAHQLGFRSPTAITSRFPELAAQLRCSHRRDHTIHLRL